MTEAAVNLADKRKIAGLLIAWMGCFILAGSLIYLGSLTMLWLNEGLPAVLHEYQTNTIVALLGSFGLIDGLVMIWLGMGIHFNSLNFNLFLWLVMGPLLLVICGFSLVCSLADLTFAGPSAELYASATISIVSGLATLYALAMRARRLLKKPPVVAPATA